MARASAGWDLLILLLGLIQQLLNLIWISAQKNGDPGNHQNYQTASGSNFRLHSTSILNVLASLSTFPAHETSPLCQNAYLCMLVNG